MIPCASRKNGGAGARPRQPNADGQLRWRETTGRQSSVANGQGSVSRDRQPRASPGSRRAPNIEHVTEMPEPPRVRVAFPGGVQRDGWLLRWGQAPGGQWWAQVVVQVPADAISQVDGEDYGEVPKEAPGTACGIDDAVFFLKAGWAVACGVCDPKQYLAANESIGPTSGRSEASRDRSNVRRSPSDCEVWSVRHRPPVHPGDEEALGIVVVADAAMSFRGPESLTTVIHNTGGTRGSATESPEHHRLE
jgi:hypothetical protein